MAALIVSAFPSAVRAVDYGTEVPLDWKHNPGKTGLWMVDWSPDGKWLAVCGMYKENGDSLHVFLIPSQGGVPKDLTSDITSIAAYARFTPDSREVVFSHSIADGDSLLPFVEAVNISTGERRVLVRNGYSGLFSPDGKLFAYQTYRRGTIPAKLICMDLGTNAKTVLATDTTGNIRPFISLCFDASGTHVITSLPTDRGDKLFSIPVSGGEPVRVTADTLRSEWGPLDYSPQGSRILYTPALPGQFGTGWLAEQIHVFNTATGASAPLIPDSENEIGDACWSPDGKSFCYILKKPTGAKLFIKDIDTGSPSLAVASGKPAGFDLKSNYPNPFNPSTTISFTLPASGPVSLSISDITGRKVRDLVSGPLSAGSHSVVWDGRDASGKAVSSGVYISRLTRGGNAVSRRMVLMK
jgi:Tol biopolymer transport system component